MSMQDIVRAAAALPLLRLPAGNLRHILLLHTFSNQSGAVRTVVCYRAFASQPEPNKCQMHKAFYVRFSCCCVRPVRRCRRIWHKMCTITRACAAREWPANCVCVFSSGNYRRGRACAPQSFQSLTMPRVCMYG